MSIRHDILIFPLIKLLRGIDKVDITALCTETPWDEEEVEPLTDIVSKINTTNEAIQNQTASLLEMLGQLHGLTISPSPSKLFQKLFEFSMK